MLRAIQLGHPLPGIHEPSAPRSEGQDVVPLFHDRQVEVVVVQTPCGLIYPDRRRDAALLGTYHLRLGERVERRRDRGYLELDLGEFAQIHGPARLEVERVRMESEVVAVEPGRGRVGPFAGCENGA